MGQSLASQRLRDRLVGIVVGGRHSAIEPRIECVASLQVPAENVVAALSALSGALPSLRRFLRRDSDRIDRARGHLLEAFRSLGYDAAHRDNGVRIWCAQGRREEVEHVISSLAPYVTPASFVEFDGANGEKSHWLFSGGAISRQVGEHPLARTLISHGNDIGPLQG